MRVWPGCLATVVEAVVAKEQVVQCEYARRLARERLVMALGEVNQLPDDDA